ncbi:MULTISPECIES: cation:proton antiporter [Enterocloster]|uniref:Transporter, CPA2 family n=1 Tax=Enterocloster lavalensis TaxID=460384 RepID=A0A1I0DE00_9FIRM|nr:MULTISPECIES: cation:proton antiporter [Enterocloster]MDR3758638.1 cation:proton antiporter [Enterocloster sp.]PST35242.1 potassium transporter [Enterocloster lavalensis]SET29786.1 transporter, CPA2 family [Enterocloster lavalensis]
MMIEIARLIITIAAALLAGKLISKLKLPAILGWLIAGMVLGPHAAGLLSAHLMESGWYEVTESLLECTVGLMIGTELIWSQMKKTGKQIVVMTVIESLGTFLVVSLVFSLICIFTDLPIYLAFLFGGIALATAPAPSLSIVNEMRTSGPVTSTLIPMAALDDLVGALVFFLVIAVVTARTSTRQIPVFVVVLLVFFPVILGAVIGFAAGKLLGRVRSPKGSVLAASAMILFSTAVGLILNWYVLPAPVLNFLLIGMAFSTVFANMIPLEQLGDIMRVLKPAVGFSLVVVILNLGAPLDYHLILGAGIYTAVYIASRALGKYGSAFFGAAVTGAPKTVRNYLGLTLLPHSGVSLIFTGIAVSTLTPVAPEYASLIQGTIAAAAVINEIIAVFMAKKGFEWAGELPGPKLRGGVHP